MSNYSIKDIENLSGIKAHTLRIWEQRYQIVIPKRTDTNIRYYTDEQLKQVLNISLLNTQGYKISKIAMMSDNEMNEAIKSLQKLLNDEEVYINRLIAAMINFDRKGILNLLSSYPKVGTLPRFFMDVLFPFFERVGMLWASSEINPAQEHFASNIVKRFLISEIEALPERKSDKGFYLLMLPYGEYHELSLLLAEYILKDKGEKILYLGSSVPMENISKIISQFKIHAVICVGVIKQSKKNMTKIMEEYGKVANTTDVFFAGSAFQGKKLSFPKGTKLLKSFAEIKNV